MCRRADKHVNGGRPCTHTHTHLGAHTQNNKTKQCTAPTPTRKASAYIEARGPNKNYEQPIDRHRAPIRMGTHEIEHCRMACESTTNVSKHAICATTGRQESSGWCLDFQAAKCWSEFDLGRLMLPIENKKANKNGRMRCETDVDQVRGSSRSWPTCKQTKGPNLAPSTTALQT